MKKTTLLTLFCALWGLSASAQIAINIDANNRGPKVSPMHYGIFYEDINHAADGGLYAELIRNRSFEDGKEYGKPATMEAWSTKGSGIQAKLIKASKKTKLLNSVQRHALHLQLAASSAAPALLVNEGYWGINAVKNRTYKLSFFARGNYNGTVKAQLLSGDTIYAETAVKATLGNNWTKYTATLTATANNPKAKFALIFDGAGSIDLDVVSLFPPTYRDRENGLRPDLMKMLAEMHPKFLRFPGGCFVEGQISSENAFHWEQTIGPIEERPGHWNVNWGYRTTDGIGFHEYLQMAEDLNAKPLYVVNVGLWHGGMTPYNKIQPWIDECLAALEYANGPVTSKYGAMRAKNGHPEPFNIEYLEIGNENNQPNAEAQSDHYYERYEQFRQAVLAKYPNMNIIGNVVAWGDDDPKWESELPVDLLDEHYYRYPAWFTKAFRKYDSYPRQLPNGQPAPKVYVGEYAVTSGFGEIGNMNAALGEAVYMMGMENNSDIVPMNSYAPIFVNENDEKWTPDMIRFNSERVMGTPSYYVQQLMPQHIGTQVVKVEQIGNLDEKRAAEKDQVTPKKSKIGFATWKTAASFQMLQPADQSIELKTIEGDWATHSQGIISQTSDDEHCVAVLPTEVSDHYTLKVRARKDRGDEGFMVVFNYVDDEHYSWVNFGGWGNTQHGLETINGSGKVQLATKAGKVKKGQWYDVTLQVAGDSIKCWLDNDLIFDKVLEADVVSGVFSSATIDENTKELIVKIVNTGAEATKAKLNVANFPVNTAHLTLLAAEDGMAENTIEEPTNIWPSQHELTVANNQLTLDVAPFSLNIIHLSYTNATDKPAAHDPVMAYEDGTYHLYFTGNRIKHYTSPDRKTWTFDPNPVMTSVPAWTRDSVPGFKEEIWAPDVIRWHGKWWMAYSCSSFGINSSAIGVMTTPSLNNPTWTDEGCIVTSIHKRDNWNAIDPCFVIDENDNPWMVWGSFWDGIQIAKLDQNMHMAKGEKPRTLARRYDPKMKNQPANPTSKFAGTNAIEAPFIMKHGDYYYLFVSWDYCCIGKKSTYSVSVGRSKTVDGPYLDRNGKDMRLGGGTPFFKGDKIEYEAAGHSAAYNINGEDLFICHGYSSEHDGLATLIQKPIKWTSDGWPTVE